nr:MAG TPA: hypothetical protein [Caudoviricetes sp.]
MFYLIFCIACHDTLQLLIQFLLDRMYRMTFLKHFLPELLPHEMRISLLSLPQRKIHPNQWSQSLQILQMVLLVLIHVLK